MSFYEKDIVSGGDDTDIIREFVTRILLSYVESKVGFGKPLKCLDGIASTAQTGIAWKSRFGKDIFVAINCENEGCSTSIEEDIVNNGFEIEVLSKDICVILHEISYNFIYLDCKTEATFYLDAAFRNLSRNGVLVISTRDDPALQVSNPDVAYRRYGGRIVRTCYSHELAVRVVIAALARSAAKYNKGIRVLCCFKYKSTFTIAVMVQKGPKNADNCLRKISMLLHCMSCEDRVFSDNQTGLFSSQSSKNDLKSKCRNLSHTVQVLGPLWNSEIFDEAFIQTTLNGKGSLSDSLRNILEIILEEARCPKELSENEESVREKRGMAPPLYYNLHKHQLKTSQLKSIPTVIVELRNAGYRASRTHFDRLAVRTNASLETIYSVMAT